MTDVVDLSQMKFENLVFRPGINLTVRKGDKWDALKTGDKLFAVPADDEIDVVELEVLETIYMGHFSELTAQRRALLCFEHDPACQNYDGLYEVMKGVYEGFHFRDAATLVFFRVLD